jgi:peroxiredoxin
MNDDLASKIESQVKSAEDKWLDYWQTGPTRTRWNSVPLQIGDKAPNFQLQNSQGERVDLQDFWQAKPTLILFWRHFGCSCGMDRIARLKDEFTEYEKLGANVVVIGQGEPERSGAYAKTHGLPYPILSDPDFEVYQSYGVLEGKASQVVYDAPDEYLQCDYDAGVELQKSRSHSPRALVDNPWQLQAEFVVDRAGVIRLAYRYQYCEDWPNPLVLYGAIKEANWDNGS